MLFLKILNMSISACYVVIVVYLLRIFFKRLPKVISYCMWMIVLFKLICPFSIESAFGIMPTQNITINTSDEYVIHKVSDENLINSNNLSYKQENLNTNIVNETKTNNIYNLKNLGSFIWSIGIIILAIYNLFNYIKLNKLISTSIPFKDNIYKCDNIQTPFVLGIINPKIYIPFNMSDKQYKYVILHEKAHIKHLDYIIKTFYYFVTIIHWFNPLVWLSYNLMSKDMEMNCDEYVIKNLSFENKKEYCDCLLSLATDKHFQIGCQFGENNVKVRVKNVLGYKKPIVWITISAIIVSVLIGILCITTKKTNSSQNQNNNINFNSANIDTNEIYGTEVYLDYADDDRVIFHGYFGLFVYDLSDEKIIRSIDLKELNLNKMQGDNYCDITVNKTGNIITLHKINSEKCYIYNIAENSLKEKEYKASNDKFDNFITSDKAMKLLPDYSGFGGAAVALENGSYGYLNNEDGTIGSISYINENNKWYLFGEFTGKVKEKVQEETQNVIDDSYKDLNFGLTWKWNEPSNPSNLQKGSIDYFILPNTWNNTSYDVPYYVDYLNSEIKDGYNSSIVMEDATITLGFADSKNNPKEIKIFKTDYELKEYKEDNKNEKDTLIELKKEIKSDINHKIKINEQEVEFTYDAETLQYSFKAEFDYNYIYYNIVCYFENGNQVEIVFAIWDGIVECYGEVEANNEVEINPNSSSGIITLPNTGEPKPAVLLDTFNEEVNNFEGVSMKVLKSTPTTAEVEFTNTTNLDVEFGEDYSLQKFHNGEWYNLSYLIDNAAFNSIAYVVPKDEPILWDVDWKTFHGILSKGKYRIVKSVMDFRGTGNFTKYYLTDEFSIK